MKKIFNRKFSLTLMLMMLIFNINSLAFNFGVDGVEEIKVDTGIIGLFSTLFRFLASMVLIVQIIVSILALVTIIWSVINYISGQNIDLGKMLLFVGGAFITAAFIWLAPFLLSRITKNNSGKSTGAVIRVERLKINKPVGLENIEVK